MSWTHKLSNTMRTIGAIPYMFIVFAPSLILTVFNIYFNLSVFETVGAALGLSYGYYQKLKWFVYLSSILLIMRPLIEQLFATSGNSINDTEESYLKMMKWVGIGIIAVGAVSYLVSYLVSDIMINEYKTMSNPTWWQTFTGFDKEISGKRPINFFEFIIDLSSMFASYFTETLAGFMLITSKDILFPSDPTTAKSNTSSSGGHKHKLKKEAMDTLTRMENLVAMTNADIISLLGGKKDDVFKEKSRLLGYNESSFSGHDNELAKFKSLKDQIRTKLDDVVKNGVFNTP